MDPWGCRWPFARMCSRNSYSTETERPDIQNLFGRVHGYLRVHGVSMIVPLNTRGAEDGDIDLGTGAPSRVGGLDGGRDHIALGCGRR